MQTIEHRESNDIQAAQLQYMASTDRLLDAAEKAKRDRDQLFTLLRERRHSAEASPCR